MQREDRPELLKIRLIKLVYGILMLLKHAWKQEVSFEVLTNVFRKVLLATVFIA